MGIPVGIIVGLGVILIFCGLFWAAVDWVMKGYQYKPHDKADDWWDQVDEEHHDLR